MTITIYIYSYLEVIVHVVDIGGIVDYHYIYIYIAN